MKTKTVLFVDDNQMLLNCLQKAFRRIGGYVIMTATNVKDAMAIVLANEIDFVVSDINMPDVNGVEFYRSLRKMSNLVPFMFMSGKVSHEEIRTLLGKDYDGGFRAIAKPLNEREIIAAMDSAA